MGPYALKRLLSVAWVMLGLSLLAFGLVRLVPGDTATILLGTRYTDEDARALRERLGLDRPLPIQYARWASGVLTLDLGTTTTGREVTAELGDAFGVTAQLALLAFVFAAAVGVGAGVAGGLGPGSRLDRVLQMVSLGGLAVPGFWLGTLLVLAFSVKVRLLPSGGYVPLSAGFAESLSHLVLPAVALGLPVAAVLARTARGAVARTLGQDHVRTARAKGLTRRAVILRHVLRNAAPQVLTVAGVQAGWLLAGSAVIEALFSVPGLGRLALSALERRDYATLQGVILLAGLVFTLLNLLVDLLHAAADPRVAEEARGG